MVVGASSPSPLCAAFPATPFPLDLQRGLVAQKWPVHENGRHEKGVNRALNDIYAGGWPRAMGVHYGTTVYHDR